MNLQLILKDLHELLSIKSLPSMTYDNAPFGLEMRKTLDWFLSKAKEYGLEVYDGDGFYGWAQLEQAAKTNNVQASDMFAALGHLDVVDANAAEWSVPPFALTEKDGFLFGRGVVDNKGPALVVLHVLKKLKEDNVTLKHRVRLICGCNEESGSACLKQYNKDILKGKAEMPKFSIVPDADFPCVNSEKGIMHVTFSFDLDKQFKQHVSNLSFGDINALNVVPDTASFSLNQSVIKSFKGVAGHAMKPDIADNAAWKLFKDLSPLSPLAKKIYDNFCTKDAAKKLGIASSCPQSGDLTLSLNHGIINDNNKLELSFDMRLPITANKDNVVKQIEKQMGCSVVNLKFKNNLFIDKNNPLVKTLLKIYTDCTAENLPPVQTGGGTYARELPNAIAFGPTFKDTETNIHNKDECISLENFKKWFDIYYKAIIELDKL